MYYVEKTLEISSCHQLYLDYESKCENLHGHNWIIKVYCKAKELDSNGPCRRVGVTRQHGILRQRRGLKHYRCIQ